ncbi:Hypothetical predicted protein [Mytilus galloprovincialis]|uniref:Uncharacterized protein n=1 Tax=Mytilus galloprovincialis TaxID=29158 RepID=A0A8B6CRY2_MYTGA|nr:Hypothetical predicted protein [Mytilus galloprovincialis]
MILNISPCDRHLELGIERYIFEHSLLDFKYGFSLMDWLSTTGLKNTTVLRDQALTDLNEVLGVIKYNQADECSKHMLPYSSSQPNGWNNECPSMPNSLNPLSSYIACYIPDHCTAVDCCLDVELLDRSFHIFVDIDSCYYRLTIGVERMSYTLNLINDYKWVCLESEGPCVMSTHIFKNTLMRKPLCDFSREVKAEGINQ